MITSQAEKGSVMSHVEIGALLPNDEHNRALAENVHPSNWVNPEPAGRYNIVVHGSRDGWINHGGHRGQFGRQSRA